MTTKHEFQLEVRRKWTEQTHTQNMIRGKDYLSRGGGGDHNTIVLDSQNGSRRKWTTSKIREERQLSRIFQILLNNACAERCMCISCSMSQGHTNTAKIMHQKTSKFQTKCDLSHSLPYIFVPPCRRTEFGSIPTRNLMQPARKIESTVSEEWGKE